MASSLILFTDDTRLSEKASRLSHEYLIPIPVFKEYRIDGLTELFKEAEQVVVFLDLDARSFETYSIAEDILSGFRNILIIAFALSIEPNIVQKAKLVGINTLMQRYKAEELLRKLCTDMQDEKIIQ